MRRRVVWTMWAALLLSVAVGVGHVEAQPRPGFPATPGFPPVSIPQAPPPPNISAPLAGMPPQGFGANGISQPVISNSAFPGASGIDSPPQSVTPQLPTPRPMPRFEMPGPQFENVYKCSHCNTELGRGSTRPDLARCPKCGVRFDNATPAAKARAKTEFNQSFAETGAALGKFAVVAAVIVIPLAVLAVGGFLLVKIVSALAGGGKAKTVKRRRRPKWDDFEDA